MNRIKRESNHVVSRDLEQVIEPLASYICATDQPKAALMTALAVLFSEVEVTSRTASAHLVTFAGKALS